MTLPQKIRLLADFAGYPAGEYSVEVTRQPYNPSSLDTTVRYVKESGQQIHPDIIKATSGQGIRSEVTDGEESLSRTKEYTTCYGIDCPGCKHCEPSTPQTEPIESQIDEDPKRFKCKRCSKTNYLADFVSPPLESKYEECAKEIYGYLHILMASSDKAAISLIAKLVKEYF